MPLLIDDPGRTWRGKIFRGLSPCRDDPSEGNAACASQPPAGYRQSISIRSPHAHVTQSRTTLSPSFMTSTDAVGASLWDGLDLPGEHPGARAGISPGGRRNGSMARVFLP